MRILGIDPGLGCTGYGIIEAKKKNIVLLEAGIIRTKAKQDLSARLECIYNGLLQIAKEYHPEVLVIEEIYSHYQHPRTAIMMAHARGVICLVAATMKIFVVGYSNKKIKKAIVGTGAANKVQVQKSVKEILNLKQEPSPNDVADALALAIAHAHIYKKRL